MGLCGTMDLKFLNTLKVPLPNFHYDKPSTLYNRICRRRVILCDFIKRALGPLWNHGPKIPEHPKGTTTKVSL